MMKNIQFICTLIVALSSFTFSGCVVGRRTVDLQIPELQVGESTGVSVTVSDPEDRRIFENKPPSPSTPSIDGDVNQMTVEEKEKIDQIKKRKEQLSRTHQEQPPSISSTKTPKEAASKPDWMSNMKSKFSKFKSKYLSSKPK